MSEKGWRKVLGWGAREEEIDAGFTARDGLSREQHGIALDMCDSDREAETTLRLYEHARRVDAQTNDLAEQRDVRWSVLIEKDCDALTKDERHNHWQG